MFIKRLASTFRILVPCKRVIDYSIRIQVLDNGTVQHSNVKHSLNPFDEIAIEEALRIKERFAKHKGNSGSIEIVAVSIGPIESMEVLRTALAMGVDKAVLLEHPPSTTTQPIDIAKALKALADQIRPRLVIMGKQAIDDDASQTGPMLSALLDWPLAVFASKVDVCPDTDSVQVVREVEEGLETVRFKLPAVITTDLRLNEPRYATLLNIMKTKTKPSERVLLSDILSEQLGGHVKVLKVEEPVPRKPGKIVDSVKELVDCLKSDGVL